MSIFDKLNHNIRLLQDKFKELRRFTDVSLSFEEKVKRIRVEGLDDLRCQLKFSYEFYEKGDLENSLKYIRLARDTLKMLSYVPQLLTKDDVEKLNRELDKTENLIRSKSWKLIDLSRTDDVIWMMVWEKCEGV